MNQLAEYEESTTLFKDDDYQSRMLQTMHELFQAKELVDVVLCAQEKEFPCHRNVLACTSDYFRAMFTTDLSEKRQERIKFPELDAESLEIIIQYAYTGKLEINKTNAQGLLAAASLFQISPILEACAQFMESQLEISNCVGIYCFAQIHDCKELQMKAKEHIEKCFSDVATGEEFLSLPQERIVELIASNELNVESEEVVYDAILSWVKHDINDREKQLPELFKHLRLALLSPNFVDDKILVNNLIVKSNECKRMLRDFKHVESANFDQVSRGSNGTNILLRSGMIKPDHCFIFIGGKDHNNKPPANCYSILGHEVFSIADFQDLGDRYSVYVEDPACIVTENNLILVAGGNYVFRDYYFDTLSDDDSFDEYDGEETVRRDVYQYDNDHDTWINRPPMLFPKSNFSLACVENKIYSFGGLTINQHPTEIIECYDIAINKWCYVGMMPTKLVDLSTVVHNNAVYVIGGRSGVGAHNVLIKFEPKSSEWTPLASMPTPRFNFGACVVENEIYVIGGLVYSHTSRTIHREALNSVEIYNISKNQWRQGPDLPVNLYNIGLSYVHGSLYACGSAMSSQSPYRPSRVRSSNVVYKLDLAMSTWKCVERDFSDIRDYTCITAKLHTRKLSRIFRPDVDT